MSGPLAARFQAVGDALLAAGFPDDTPVLRALFVDGEAVPPEVAHGALPAAAWQTLVVKDTAAGTVATGRLTRRGELLVWNDPGEPTGEDALPESLSGRWLAVGPSIALPAALAGRGARVRAVAPSPRAGMAVKRTAMLSGVEGVDVWTGPLEEAPSLGRYAGVAGAIPFSCIDILNPILDIDGDAVLRIMDPPDEPADLAAAIHASFAERPWSGGWGPAGRLVLRADDDPGWRRLSP